MDSTVMASPEAEGRARIATLPEGKRENFDPKRLEPGRFAWLTSWIWEGLYAYPRRLLGWSRRVLRVLPLPGDWRFVLHYDDVREVLSHETEFEVPWRANMRHLTGGTNFVLGMSRPSDPHAERYTELAKAFPLEEIRHKIEQPAHDLAADILNRSGGRLDAVQDLVIAVPAKLCESYYGLRIEDPVRFGHWSLALSAWTFGPTTTPEHEQLAMDGADGLSHVIREAIAAPPPGTVVERMVAARLPPDVIHAQLLGMVMGFIPTDVLAGGNILETLLKRKDFLARARAAALSDDDELLWKCLREALRFRHINLGPWRRATVDYTLGSGGPRAYTIKKGKRVLASTQSAMFDPARIERPHVFDPYRREEDYLIFGVGRHWCIGAYIAKAQLTQTFKPLLRRNALRAERPWYVRTTRFNNLFPLHLKIRFDA